MLSLDAGIVGNVPSEALLFGLGALPTQSCRHAWLAGADSSRYGSLVASVRPSSAKLLGHFGLQELILNRFQQGSQASIPLKQLLDLPGIDRNLKGRHRR